MLMMPASRQQADENAGDQDQARDDADQANDLYKISPIDVFHMPDSTSPYK